MTMEKSGLGRELPKHDTEIQGVNAVGKVTLLANLLHVGLL